MSKTLDRRNMPMYESNLYLMVTVKYQSRVDA